MPEALPLPTPSPSSRWGFFVVCPVLLCIIVILTAFGYKKMRISRLPITRRFYLSLVQCCLRRYFPWLVFGYNSENNVLATSENVWGFMPRRSASRAISRRTTAASEVRSCSAIIFSVARSCGVIRMSSLSDFFCIDYLLCFCVCFHYSKTEN